MSRWYITDKIKMERKYLLLLIVCIFTLTLYSCGAIGMSTSAAVVHQGRVDVINLNYKKCLASAQTADDSSNCKNNYEDAIEKENERYEEAKSVLEEIQACEDCQISILEWWGYPEKEAKKIAKKLSPYRDQEKFSFDCGEAINELINSNHLSKEEKCFDKIAIQLFKDSLPKYGLSTTDPIVAAKQYYKDEMYNVEKPGNFKNPVDNCLSNIRIGRGIKINKELLIKMGLLDDDNDDENGDDDPNDVPSNPEPTTTTPNTPGLNSPTASAPPVSTYQTEASAISQLSIAKYNVDEVELTIEKQQELDAVIAFLKKWPDAHITIVGHTCNIGTNDVNNIVGMRRAHQAKLYLVSQGIDENRIEEVSKAAEEPCASNDNREGRQLNRRITFIIK